MANSYTLSSSKLALRPQDIPKAQEIVGRIKQEIEQAAEDDESGCTEGMGVQVEVQPDGVWFCHDESINAEQVVQFAQALLDELMIDKPFVFSWAYTCSAPRLDEFGGGACCIRRGQDPYWVDAHSQALVVAQEGKLRQSPS